METPIRQKKGLIELHADDIPIIVWLEEPSEFLECLLRNVTTQLLEEVGNKLRIERPAGMRADSLPVVLRVGCQAAPKEFLRIFRYTLTPEVARRSILLVWKILNPAIFAVSFLVLFEPDQLSNIKRISPSPLS
ncbi:MAG: hypothetical protein ACC661_10125, partial [Verrucomicrobiales bacterium]